MPNCFQLTRKGETSPIVLQKLDEELCTLLNKPVHPTQWVYGWYDKIGLYLSFGKNWSWIRVHIYMELSEELHRAEQDAVWIEWLTSQLKVLDYLEENFTSDSWVEIGRRRRD